MEAAARKIKQAAIDGTQKQQTGGGIGGQQSAEDAEVEALKKNAEKLQRACAAVGKMKGALQHVREGAPLPDDQGVKSTTYSIERIEDW